MPQVSGIYDNGPISPIAKIKENLSIWTKGKWEHFRIDYIEPMPRSSPMVVDVGPIAANGIIAKQVVAILQLSDLEFLHLRWEPLDDVEGALWEEAGTARFTTGSVQARVTPFTSLRDPYLATTTFFILGKNRDMNLEVINPNAVAIPVARFVFFGFRYILEGIPVPTVSTYLPAQGK